MSGAAKRKFKKQQENSITKLRKLDALCFINIVAPTNMSESSAVDQSGDHACNELNSSNPEGMIPLEAEAPSLGSHAESGHESWLSNACSSFECSSSKSSSSLLPEYSGDVALWKNISKEVREYWSMKGPIKSARIMMAILQLPSDSLRTKAENSLNISSFESIFLVKKLLKNGLFTPLPQEVFSALYVFCLVTSTLQHSFQVLHGFSDWKHASSRLIDHEIALHTIALK